LDDDAAESCYQLEAFEGLTVEKLFDAQMGRRTSRSDVYAAALPARIGRQGPETQIEASFCAALRIAREQKSISLVKIAEATYAEYCRQKATSPGRGFRVPLW
jgi:hypothetical protein